MERINDDKIRTQKKVEEKEDKDDQECERRNDQERSLRKTKQKDEVQNDNNYERRFSEDEDWEMK